MHIRLVSSYGKRKDVVTTNRIVSKRACFQSAEEYESASNPGFLLHPNTHALRLSSKRTAWLARLQITSVWFHGREPISGMAGATSLAAPLIWAYSNACRPRFDCATEVSHLTSLSTSSHLFPDCLSLFVLTLASSLSCPC
jgi:hypothetical protein